MKRVWILLLLLVAACSRGPDQDTLRKQVQGQIDKSFKPGLLELAALKRQGSSPLPASEKGAQRVLVYYNATLKLKEGYDFKDWEGLSPATLAQVLGGREKGVIGVKAKENQPGDLLYVYGSGTFERSGDAWSAASSGPREHPDSNASTTRNQHLIDQTRTAAARASPGSPSRSGCR